MSGRPGRARARDARPEGRDPQPQPTATRSGASMAQSAWLLARQGSPVAKRCATITTITNTTEFPKNVPVLQLETVLAVKMAVDWRVRPSRGERQRARGPARPARPREPRPRAAREARARVWATGWNPGPGAIERERRSRLAEGGCASARRPGRCGRERKRAWPRACPSGADVRPVRRAGRCASRASGSGAQGFRIGGDRAQRRSPVLAAEPRRASASTRHGEAESGRASSATPGRCALRAQARQGASPGWQCRPGYRWRPGGPHLAAIRW